MKRCAGKRQLFLSVVSMAAMAVAVSGKDRLAAEGTKASSPDCAALAARYVDRQTNPHAAWLRLACGGTHPADAQAARPPVHGTGAANIGGSDLDVITGGQTFPAVTQAESVVWAAGSTVVVAYNDTADAPTNYSGLSLSTDGGVTFTRLRPAPLATGFGDNFGGPFVAYDKKLALWFAGNIVSGCGTQGIGIWTSPDGSVWTAGTCAHTGTADDRPSLWVDNNASSPYYGRLYLSFNDFGGIGELTIVNSDDGTTWATAQVDASFIRNVNIDGGRGADGTVFIAGMDEGGGAGGARVNHVYRSTDGGGAWNNFALTPSFSPPGAGLCRASTYFYMVPPIWRTMGWGQLAAGTGGNVHLVFSGAGQVPGDLGDIFYTRSADNGTTWSAAIPLNSDQALNLNVVQWIPSISVNDDGHVLAAWYDRRNTMDGLDYEYFGRMSLDNGVTWGPDEPISDVVIPQPGQPDANIDYCYGGDTNRHAAVGQESLVAWTDGRKFVAFQSQEDVEFDRASLCSPMDLSPAVLPNGTAGTAYSQTVSASGGTVPYTYALSGTLPSGLTLDVNTGLISGTPVAAGASAFTIIATDSNGCTGSQDYTLLIDPTGCPGITLLPVTLPPGQQGVPYSQTITANGGTGPYSFALTAGVLPTSMALDTSGLLSGSPSTSGTFAIRVTATDSNGCTGSRSYSLVINCPTIALSPTSPLPTSYAGIPYVANVTGNGGSAPYTFEITTGTLPDGIFVGEGGTIFGVPTQAGTKNFTLRATDSNGCQGSQGYSLPSQNCPPGNKYCEPFNGGLNLMVPSDVCGGGAEWYAANNCPSSNDIGHTRNAHARWGDILACDAYATAVTEDYLTSPAIDITTCNSGKVTLRFDYLLSIEQDSTNDRVRVEVMSNGGAPQVIADNGAGGPTCSGAASPGKKNLGPASGWLPAFFTISAANTFQVRFVGETEMVGSTGEGFLIDDVIVQCLCPSNMDLDPDVLPNGTVNVAYSATVTATGGAPPYTYSASTGQLQMPPGLSLDPATGAITGIPTQAGIFTFDITATDVNSCKVTNRYNVVISPPSCPAITISPSTLPDGTLGVPYSQLLTATGGAAPYTWFVTAGALPPGLALDPALGVISGTPTTAGIYPFTLTAVDANFCTGSADFAIIINPAGCPAITLSPTSLPNGKVGALYSQTLTASGGSAPYTYTVTAGTLPPGLTLASSTGIISGKPTLAGSFNFRATASDITLCTGSRSYSIVIDPRPAVDFVVGEGLGITNGNRVRVYLASGTATSVSFIAYGAGKWGTNVASGDVNVDGTDEILTGPGPGDVYGPQVRGFKADGTVMGKINYYAYGTLRYGVNVTSGDLDGDGFSEIVSGAGPGAVFGPHVRGWNFDNVSITAIQKINYFAYSTLKWGVNVARGDVDGDVYKEILTGAGPGSVFASTVRGWNYDNVQLTSMGKINFNAFTYAGFGVNVAGGDVEADGFDEIACTPGPGPTHPSRYLGFNFDGGPISALTGFDVNAYTTTFYGGRVGSGGDLDADGSDDLLCGAGRDSTAPSLVKSYAYNGTGLAPLTSRFFTPFGTQYGVNVTAGFLGY